VFLNLLHGTGLEIRKIWAVCNPMLVNSFSLTLEKFTTRAETSRLLFYSQKWRLISEDKEDTARREATLEKFQSRCSEFPWNTEDGVCTWRRE
jgi:hypothetical protein